MVSTHLQDWQIELEERLKLEHASVDQDHRSRFAHGNNGSQEGQLDVWDGDGGSIVRFSFNALWTERGWHRVRVSIKLAE